MPTPEPKPAHPGPSTGTTVSPPPKGAAKPAAKPTPPASPPSAGAIPAASLAAAAPATATGVAAATATRTTPGSAQPPAGDARIPGTWEAIKVGSLVLATEGHAEGWFESLVVATRADDRFLLRWRDWPDLPEFTRRRDELALLHPATDPRG